ncbi:MAG: DUF1549 domain-containing protein, partial [Planctomycetales bacterium]|nr:DUF1549 domain-containing protein [Planctomycetales bacterium]
MDSKSLQLHTSQRQRPLSGANLLAWAAGVALCLTSLAAIAAEQGDAIKLLPRDVKLEYRGGLSQRILVERMHDESAVEDLTAQALGSPDWKLESSDEQVFRIEGDRLLPVRPGEAQLHLTSPLGRDQINVSVDPNGTAPEWQFGRHVLPVLSRAGCNMGACHGALAGKGGFKLSLRGYYPAGDFRAITQDARGRRIELASPKESLLLTKPSGTVPHKGGLRLPADSADYRLLTEWIRAGARGPTDGDAELLNIVVTPAIASLRPNSTQQLLVTAHYSDGGSDDVTRWAKFSSSNESVAGVSEQGVVTVEGFGEGAIVVWFSSQIVMARIVSPYDRPLDDRVWQEMPAANLVDRCVNDKLKQLRIEPSPRCSDETFVRRVYLDVTGRLPEPTAVTQFVADASVDKRSRLIDTLLSQDAYVDYWTHRWSDLLLVNGRRLRPAALNAYYGWIRSHVERNTPWDQFVREVVTAKGSSTVNGATNFYALHQDPESMSENVCQAFLGLSIGCAKCHNHPL